MAKRDYYEVLGLSKTATEREIKKSYRKMAMEHHPDRNQGDKASEEKFKEISEAYEILSDEKKRAQYDQFGHAAFENGGMGSGFGGFGGFGGFSGFSGFEDLGDIVGDFFGGGHGRSRTGPMKGADLRYAMSISFEEAAFGTEKEISILRDEECDHCHGTGAKPGTQVKTCQECHGTGQVRRVMRTAFGNIAQTSPCPTCNGEGHIIEEKCPRCRGSKTVQAKKTLKVKIPAGMEDGAMLRMQGDGQIGLRGGPRGDLYVQVDVKPHPLFQREGNHVVLDMPISFVQAALGDELEVPTLDGNVKYKIKEGTQTGTVFRLRGKGIPYLRGSGRGDQLVRVEVEVPKNLSEKQKEILRSFAKETGENVEEQHKGFWKRVKDSIEDKVKDTLEG